MPKMRNDLDSEKMEYLGSKMPTCGEVKEEIKDEAKDESQPESKDESKPEAKPETQSDVKDKTETRAAVKSDTNTKIPSTVTPEIVKLVHEFYEELGRVDVRAVMDMEKTEQEIPKTETKSEAQPETESEYKVTEEPKPEVEARHQPKGSAKLKLPVGRKGNAIIYHKCPKSDIILPSN